MAASPKTAESPSQAALSKRRDVLTMTLLSISALVAVASFATFFSRWWGSGISDPAEILRIASQEFVAGRPVVAGELAETVSFELPPELPPESEAESLTTEDESAELPPEEVLRQQWIRLRDFLVGAGKVTRARSAGDARTRRGWLIEAIEPLVRSRDAGFPEGRQTDGDRMLGEAYFQLGQYEDAVTHLQRAADRDPTLRRELLATIAEAQLRTGGSWTQRALATIDENLREPSLQRPDRWRAEEIRIRALIDLKQYEEAEQAINRILDRPITGDVASQSEQSDWRDRIRMLSAVSRIREAIDQHGANPHDDPESERPTTPRPAIVNQLAESISILEGLTREAAPRTSARARLWSARGLLAQGSFDDALTRLTAVRQQRPFGAESILGGLEEIELLASKGRGVEMLQTTRYLIREIGDEKGFDVGMISFQDFQSRMLAAIDALRRNGDFQNAIDTARSLPPVFELSSALVQEGIGYEQWATATLVDGTNVNGEVSRAASESARSRFRAAGDAFARAAEIRFATKDYLTAQWSAIEAYQKGRHFRRSIRLLEPYLRYEERRRLPRGLVAFGRALLAEGDEEKAIEAAETCIIEYPRDPLRYDARLLAAMAHAERRELDQARGYLLENLRDGELTPESPAWRDSLFTLGEMLYDQAYRNHLMAQKSKPDERNTLLRENQPVLSEAVRYLDQAADRYAGTPRAESAAYLSARAHMLASRWPRVEAESPDILEAARRALRAQADQELQVAMDGFVRLRADLAAREEDSRLPPKEQAILRNCFLAEAEVLHEMGRLEDAATAYRTVEMRYMNEPTALEAILGRARCAKELGRDQEANQLVRQAEIVLGRIPDQWNESFAETTRFDREGWQEYLTWMNGRIDNGGI